MATGTAQYLIDVSTVEGNRLQFRSSEELERFLKTERDAWDWLRQQPVQGQINQSVHGTIAQQLNGIKQHIPALESGNPKPASNALRLAYNDQRVPYSGSALAAFIKELRANDPLHAGLSLTAWMNPGWLNLGNSAHFRAAFATYAFDAQIHSKTATATKTAISRSLSELADSKQQIEVDTANQLAAFSRAEGRTRHIGNLLRRYTRRQGFKFRRDKELQISAAIGSISETEKLYKEQMRLKAPVDYWSEKAVSHRLAARDHRWNLVLFSACGGAAVVCALGIITKYAVSLVPSNVHTLAYVSLGTLGIVVTTIVFWVARILTRLFLSEHHLSIDAEERAVMAKTYLALTAAGTVDEKERGLVLASLFRPTADGIVKDDAAPDLSPAALTSRLLTR